MKKPLIILAGHLEKHPGYSPIYGQKKTYSQAILRAGGLPLIVSPNLPEEDLPDLIELGDGFMLCGGGDLEPDLYGGQCRVNLGGVDQERDTFEIMFLRAVLGTEKPLLAICRGIQLMNAALGGTLYGDIAAQLPCALKHDFYPRFRRDKVAHELEVLPGSLLAESLGKTNTGANSLHHQALDRLGKGLIVNAKAPDGIIEGVEMPKKPFVLGVQWHPECMPDSPEMNSLFRAFLAASQTK
ncbi:MAG: gamma-glutamyl-gamma-aminobutyrate hydrolase family protein [Anaerolineaceae bacterium]|nr:gamma-glutamyl-gamma-aminobutyrate hydrolase family protein [Anaerolineaceae bacterium]